MKNLYLRVLSLGSIYTIGNLAQQALSILLLPLYTRYLSLGDFGILALMDLTIFLISRPVVTPFLGALSRFYYKPEYEQKQSSLLFNLFTFLVVKTILLAILYWSLGEFLSDLLFGEGQAYIHIVQLHILVLLLQPMSMFLLALAIARQMAKFYVFVSLSKIVLVTGVSIYLLIHFQMGVLAIIYGNILGLAFEVIMVLPVFLKNATFKLSPSLVWEPLRYGYPMLLSGYSNILIESGDRYLLSVFTSVNHVGLYSFGYKIPQIINSLLVAPVKQSVAPIILQKEKDIQRQKRLITRLSTHFYFVGVFMALGISLLAKEATRMLTSQPAFWSAWTIVPIISFAYIQLGLGSFLSWGLILKNKSQYISGIVFVGALINVGLNLIFIPLWGIMGAAFATIIAYITLNGLYIHYSARFYGLHFELSRMGYISIVGIILYLISLLVNNLGPLYLNIAVKLIILASYPLVFFIGSFFTSTEKIHIQRLWRRSLQIFTRQTSLSH